MILLGFFTTAFFLRQGFENAQKFNSPFDQVDHAEENQQGLLPLLDLESGEAQRYSAAPSLEEAVDLEAQLGSDPLAEKRLLSDKGLLPERLLIPALDLYYPIVSVGYKEIEYEGDVYRQWDVPNDMVVGWHSTSAKLGVPGNTVLSAHHNVYGAIFANLHTLQPGDIIQIKSGKTLFSYRVARVLILKEKYEPLEVRLENARWIQSSADERLTLITCWPQNDNTHRVVVVAVPVGKEIVP